jgi:hypothetical protein
VFENRVLRRIFGPERNEVTGEWGKKLHNEKLNDLYCSPNIVRVIKWRRMRWAGHVARMGDRRGVHIKIYIVVYKIGYCSRPTVTGYCSVQNWILYLIRLDILAHNIGQCNKEKCIF